MALLSDFDLVILGSNSPRRKQIFEENLGLKRDVNYIVMKSDFGEDLDKSKYSPQEYCLETAHHKLLDLVPKVVQKFQKDSGKRWLLVTSDSVFIHNGIIYEKPRDREEARHFIYDVFRNSAMQAYTGVALAYGTDEKVIGYVKSGFTTDVDLWDYPAEMVDAYLDNYLKKLLDVSGGVVLSQEGAFLIKGYRGCFFNAAGFPIHGFIQMLLDINLNFHKK